MKPHYEMMLQLKLPLASAPKNGSVLERLTLLQNKLHKSHPIINSNGRQWFANSVAYFSIFASDGAKIYKIGREFGEQLSKVRLNLSSKYIPETEKMICIEFPENLRFHLGNQQYAHHAYVYVSNNDGDKFTNERKETFTKLLNITSYLYDEKGNPVDNYLNNYLGISFKSDDEPVEEALERAIKSSTYSFVNREYVNFVVNALIYIFSGDPDLREQRAPRIPSHPKDARIFLRNHENTSLVDMTLVGFDWAKPRHYNVDSTIRRGHPRWQPYGPKRERVKLIWIEPTTITYNKDKP